MRVLVDDGFSMTRPTGIGRHTAYVLQALDAASEVEASRIALPRLTAVRPRVARRAAYLAYLATGFAGHVARQRADVVHFTNFQPAYRKPSGVRYAVTVHDLVTFRYPQTKSRTYARYLRETIARAVRMADVVFAGTLSVRDEILADLRVAPERVHVYYIGTELLPLPPTEAERRARTLLPPEAGSAPFLLFVGSLERRKNVASLVRALMVARRAMPTLQLVLAGRPGIGYDEIEAALGEARASGATVHVMSACSDADLAALYATCAAFVFPSVYEGFGIPLLEAMRCGAPIVASDIPTNVELGAGAVEIVPGTPDGIATGVAAVLGSPTRRAAMIATGRARVAEFTLARTAAQLVTGYRFALGR